VLVGDGSVELVDDSTRGVPLGVLAGASWAPVDVAVRPGWALLIYTDGLVEGRDRDGEQLWSEGLVALLARQLETADPQWRADPGGVLTGLIDAVKVDRPHRTDDLAALLLVHLAGTDHSA
jgi:hypothetical protein